MATADATYDRINDYASVKISLARPHDIRSWSMGEVKKPETINYRTYRPEKDGLFCERIFGPEKDWECACGKYRGMKYKGMICDRCGVKVTHSRVRRKRMGHIELAAPVVHIWFFKAMPSRLGNLLNMKTSSLEKVIYFQDYVVTDPGTSDLERQQLLSEEEFRAARAEFGEGSFEAKMGADAVRELLSELDLVTLSDDLRVELAETGSKQKRKDLTNRLNIVESIRDSDNKPEWMVLDVIPVIPPDLRPLVLLDSGNFATSDLNDLYRRIINRNNRLRKLVDLNAPEVIIRNEKRMLQQSVDALFDNNRCKRPVLGSSNRPLKSLTDMIKGKQGRFRENLLGKRVDYSARSVIVVGARLKLHQCGLPKKIALELFQPFIIRKLKELGHADTIKSAKKMLERKDEEVWDILEQVIKNHPVMLNRAPTLHRMGIQAFEPTLVEGNAIHLHPLVCKGFNADFDGDQMAVHLPLSIEAQVEAHTLMLSTNNIFAPSNGRPIMSPSQDTVMGCYYISLVLPNQKGDGMIFSSLDEADHAFAQGVINLHARIKVRIKAGRFIRNGDEEKRLPAQIIETSYGRIMLNMMLPEGMDFYNYPMKSGDLATVISDCYQELGRRATIELLDDMNQLGFRESTRSGLSFATDDLVTPDDKEKIIAEAEKEVIKLRKHYERGVITEKERYNKVLETWTHAREAITGVMMQAMKEDDRGGMGYVNPVYLMAHSGARGGVEQIRQLAGMRGLMAKPTGEIIETPIKANFREGLSVLEYFSSTHGARKGLADTALKTADSGYLTRKLADVAQNVVVTMEDCGTTQGITKGIIYRGEQVEVRLAIAINGRVSRQNIVNPVTDEVVVRESQMITPEIAKKIEDMGLEKIQVRSPMTCDAPLGVCRKCYGMDMSTGDMVEEGMAVGIIAAQSIGEPGTQLTMRTFHIGGVANTSTEKNEERCKKAGFVKLIRMRHVTNGEGEIVVLNRNAEIAILDSRGRELESHKIPAGATLLAKEGDEVKAKAVLCRWNPFAAPILSEVSGKVRFEDILEGETMIMEREASGTIRRTIIDFKGDLHPQIVVEDKDGTVLDVYYLPERANITVSEGEMITTGTAVAETPREASGISDITGGLPRVTEIFEARKPKDPAVLAEIDGKVELGDKKRGKRTIIVKNESGLEVEHLVPPGKRFLVHSGDHVTAGQQLIDGPLVPHDILRVSGEEAVQQYLGHEIQQVYRSQRVEINDKHVEIIIARMLRKVKIESAGDSNMLPGSICDRFELRTVNDELSKCVKITNKGDSDYRKGQIVPRDVLEETNAKIETLGGDVAKSTKPRMATYSTQLLGITKASVQSSSFISAASFQETTKVLTEAALAGKVDNLVGLKENVILGHLIPAGTGFRTFQESEVQYNLEAMRLAAEQPTQTLEDSFPLLESATATNTMSTGTPDTEAPSDFLSAMANSGSLGDLGAEMAGGSSGGANDAAGLGSNMSSLANTSIAGEDFTKIEGIGPKIAELLNAGGIESFAQLSQTPPDMIKSVLNAGGPTFANHDPSTWPDQALLAANGEWSQLKEWQDQLIGGKMTVGMQTPKGIETLMAANDSAVLGLFDSTDGLEVGDTTTSAPMDGAIAEETTLDQEMAPPADDGLDALIMGGSDSSADLVSAPADNLTKIEGVGPKIAELLNAGGITSFAQLAATPADQVKSILTAGGGSFAVHDPTTWPQQAQMAADGKWEQLQKWQDELDGGKPAADPDDLTKVEGIGPKIAEVLGAAGLGTFGSLAAASADRIKEILDSAEGNYAAHDPTTWPQQAQLAADGKWEELQKWQDELDGGRA